MAATILTDVAYVPEVFAGYVMEEVKKKSSFYNSGAVVDSNVLVPLYGNKIHLPAWNGLSGSAEVLNDTACLTSTALTSHDQIAAILERGKIWGVNGLVSSFTGSNPLDGLANQISSFWAREIDLAAIRSATGAATGITSDGTQMVLNISGNTGAAGVFSAQAVIATRALAGEYMNDFDILVVHSAVYALLQTQQLIDFIPTADGKIVQTFMGMRVIINDNLTQTGGVYDSLVVRNGAFGYAENTDPRKAVEEGRDIKCNEDFISIQKRFVIHPFGGSFVGTPAGDTASNTELAAGANWDLAGDKNNFGVRVLKARIV